MNEERIYAKSLKLEDDQIVCTNCNSVLTIPADMIDDEYVQCTRCDTAVFNPLGNHKFITCSHCDADTFLSPRNENDLVVNCRECGEFMYNPYSDKFSPLICPSCGVTAHLPEGLKHMRYLTCNNCGASIDNKHLISGGRVTDWMRGLRRLSNQDKLRVPVKR